MTDNIASISSDVSDFLSGFGIYFEEDLSDEGLASKYYLKYRIFPTDELRATCKFDMINVRHFTDTYYETFDSTTSKFNFNGNTFTRYRSSDSLVFQQCRNINKICHIYSEKSMEEEKDKYITERNLKEFLTISFTRSESQQNKNVYLDVVKMPVVDITYDVVSIREEISDISNISNSLQKIFSLVLGIEGLTDQLNAQLCEEYLSSLALPIFPVFSKFMFMLQISPYFDAYYTTFIHYDPVTLPLQDRLDLIRSSRENVTMRSYDKLYIWMNTSFTFIFQSCLQNVADKKSYYMDNIEAIMKELDRGVKWVLSNKSGTLTTDEEDED